MLEVVGVGLGGVVDVEGFFGDEGGDVFVFLVAFGLFFLRGLAHREGGRGVSLEWWGGGYVRCWFWLFRSVASLLEISNLGTGKVMRAAGVFVSTSVRPETFHFHFHSYNNPSACVVQYARVLKFLLRVKHGSHQLNEMFTRPLPVRNGYSSVA